MTDPVSLTGATNGAPATTRKAATKAPAKSFGDTLAKAKSTKTSKAKPLTGGTAAQAVKNTSSSAATSTKGSDPATVLRPTGEKLSKVDGHPYAKIASGVDKGMYLNQMAGNPRKGEAFRVVQRDGRTFHVYGTGAHKVVEEIKPHAASKNTQKSAGKTNGA